MSQTLISRGFGALQRTITRGFFSAPASPVFIVIAKSNSNTFVIPNFSITPDCFVGFIGTIVEPVNEPVGFIGSIFDVRTFEGSICDDCNC